MSLRLTARRVRKCQLRIWLLVGTPMATCYSMGAIEPIEKETCDSQLFYYRFLLSNTDNNTITHQLALSAIPFEMPITPPTYSRTGPR